MDYPSLDAFLDQTTLPLRPGPVAIVIVEDETEIASTLRHHRRLGFAEIIVLAPAGITIDPDAREGVTLIRAETHGRAATPALINPLIEALPGRWLHYGYNAEYLYFPFCETRRVGEMLAFHTEERRDAMLCYVVDLYAVDLERFPDGVSVEEAHLDRSGYYAQARRGEDGSLLERQYDFMGGLRWRFEEHIPPERRRIDRVAIFRAQPGVRLLENHTFDQPEYNTYACPWHHNLTAAICSFRTAKALRTNPGSAYDIPGFHWHNSQRFEWDSLQLMELGLMEPGQWF
ncbi:MAG: hypothetical protein JJU40_13780 [Rhodobacteraceae bacterium]|nr:hypothetical protein [Paracoccaceae bacterium]